MNKQKLLNLQNSLTSFISDIEKYPELDYQSLCTHYRVIATAYRDFANQAKTESNKYFLFTGWSTDLPQYMYSLKHVENGVGIMRENMVFSARSILSMVDFFYRNTGDDDFDTVFEKWIEQPPVLTTILTAHRSITS